MVILPEIQKKLNLEGFTHAEQVEIVDHLEMHITQKIGAAFQGRLSADDKALFLKLTKKGNSPALETFLTTKIPNFKEVVMQTARLVVDEFNSLREK